MMRRALCVMAVLCALAEAAIAGPIPSYPAATIPLNPTTTQTICAQNGVTHVCPLSTLQAYNQSFGNGTDWLTTEAYGTSVCENLTLCNAGQLLTPGIFESSTGEFGLVGAARTSDITTLTGTWSTVGVAGWGLNYNIVTPAVAWGMYDECRRITGAGACIGIEMDATEFATATVPTPYNLPGNFSSVADWIASGGNCTAVPCWGPGGPGTLGSPKSASLAIGIVPNGANFLRGIMPDATAIQGCDGTNAGGTCDFMELARGQGLRWDASDGTAKFRIYSAQTTAGTGINVIATDAGLLIQVAGVTKVTVSTGGAVSATGFVRPGQVLFANLGTVDVSPQVGDMLNISDASACTVNTAVAAGGGTTHSCPTTYNGTSWIALVTH